MSYRMFCASAALLPWGVVHGVGFEKTRKESYAKYCPGVLLGAGHMPGINPGDNGGVE